MDLVPELNSFGRSGDLSVRYRNKNIPTQCTDRAEYPWIQILLKGLCRSCFNNSLKSKPKNQAEKWWQTKWDGKEVDASFSTEIQDQSCPLVFKTLLFPLEMDRYSGMSIYARVYKNISPQKGGERKICRMQWKPSIDRREGKTPTLVRFTVFTYIIQPPVKSWQVTKQWGLQGCLSGLGVTQVLILPWSSQEDLLPHLP